MAHKLWFVSSDDNYEKLMTDLWCCQNHVGDQFLRANRRQFEQDSNQQNDSATNSIKLSPS